MRLSEKTRKHGEVKLAIIPTVATDLVPALFKKMQENSPLIRIVDINGGGTIVPELHIEDLSKKQKRTSESL